MHFERFWTSTLLLLCACVCYLGRHHQVPMYLVSFCSLVLAVSLLELSGPGPRKLVRFSCVLVCLSLNSFPALSARKRVSQRNFTRAFGCFASCTLLPVLVLLLSLLLKGGQAPSGADETAGATDKPRSDIRSARRQLEGSGASGGQGGVPTGDVPNSSVS